MAPKDYKLCSVMMSPDDKSLPVLYFATPNSFKSVAFPTSTGNFSSLTFLFARVCTYLPSEVLQLLKKSNLSEHFWQYLMLLIVEPYRPLSTTWPHDVNHPLPLQLQLW